jgi:hypothetical protein
VKVVVGQCVRGLGRLIWSGKYWRLEDSVSWWDESIEQKCESWRAGARSFLTRQPIMGYVPVVTAHMRLNKDQQTAYGTESNIHTCTIDGNHIITLF